MSIMFRAEGGNVQWCELEFGIASITWVSRLGERIFVTELNLTVIKVTSYVENTSLGNYQILKEETKILALTLEVLRDQEI